MSLLDLFLTLAKIGLFTFGDGYAMIALIETTCVEKKQWITPDEMMNITVIAESTPGPIAINCATYVGYKQRGFAGSLAATAGMVFPSFCIIFAESICAGNPLRIKTVHDRDHPCYRCLYDYQKRYCHTRQRNAGPPPDPDIGAWNNLLRFQKDKKGGISPILLICLSALAGIAAYRF